MSAGKVLLGVVVGVAVGAAFGVLYAPAKGSATRKRIARTGTDYVEDVKEKLTGYADDFIEEYDTIKKDGKDLFEKGKEIAASVSGLKNTK